jgi:hypothetical protein
VTVPVTAGHWVRHIFNSRKKKRKAERKRERKERHRKKKTARKCQNE